MEAEEWARKVEEEERRDRLLAEEREKERLRLERLRFLDESWARIGRACMLKAVERDRKWAFFTLHFMRLQIHRRVSKLQRVWRQHKEQERRKLQEEMERRKQEQLNEAAGRVHEVMYKLNNLRDYQRRKAKRMQSLLTIQSGLRMFSAKLRRRKIRRSIARIQGFCRMIKARRHFKLVKKSVLKIERFGQIVVAKVKVKKRKAHLVKLQSFIKMRLAHRKYIVQREQSIHYLRKRKIEEAKQKIMMQRKRKEAVVTIENARYRQLHLRELRELRAYLHKLPYECRRVYFKFMEIKRSTNELVHQYHSYMDRKAMPQEMQFRYG